MDISSSASYLQTIFLWQHFVYKYEKAAKEKAGVGEQMRDERKRYKFAIKTEAKWLQFHQQQNLNNIQQY